MRRMPFAVGEISRLRGDMSSLRGTIDRLLVRVAEDGAQAASSVAPVAALDALRGRVEAACSTLSEAAELSGLFARVEGAFTAGAAALHCSVMHSMRQVYP